MRRPIGADWGVLVEKRRSFMLVMISILPRRVSAPSSVVDNMRWMDIRAMQRLEGLNSHRCTEHAFVFGTWLLRIDRILRD